MKKSLILSITLYFTCAFSGAAKSALGADGSNAILRAKAANGDRMAQALLADALYHGHPSDEAFDEAEQWAEKSSRQDCPIGTAILGAMYRTGRGRLQNEDKARKLADYSREPLLAGVEGANPVWLRWAALSPSRKTKYLDLSAFREGNKSHWARNLPLLRMAIKSGDVQAAIEWANQLHRWVIEGQENEDKKLVVDALKKARSAAHPSATQALGNLYQYGFGVPRDLEEAEACYIESAEAGWTPSRLSLVLLLAKQKLPRDILKKRLLRQHQESLQSPYAALALDWYHELESGRTLPRNSELASEWLKLLKPAQASIAIARVIYSSASESGSYRNQGSSPSLNEMDKLFRKMEALAPTPQAYKFIESTGLAIRDEKESAKWYMRAAQGGLPSAMVEVAKQYHKGFMREQSNVEARNWFRKAAATKHPYSSYWAGCFFLEEGDHEEAERLLKFAGNAGVESAWEDLGDLCLHKDASTQKSSEAASHYRKAADLGSIVAVAKLLRLIEKKTIKPLDPKEVSRWNQKVEESIRNKSKKSRIFLLSTIAQRIGSGPNGDKQAALVWWARAAEEGDDRAASIVLSSRHKENPEILAKTRAKAFSILKKRVETVGDEWGMYRLATAYDTGNGTKADQRKAAQWYEAAAEKRHGYSMQEIAYRYLTGNGVVKDKKVAKKWFRKAITLGSTSMMVLYARLHEEGKHFAADGAIAQKWYKTAAVFGDSPSMFSLCLLYLKGQLVQRDYIEAYAWANAAAATAHKDNIRIKAAEVRKKVEVAMTPEQIQQAQRQTRDFLVMMENATAVLVERIHADQPVIASFDDPLSFLNDLGPGADNKPEERKKPGEVKLTSTATAWALSKKGHLVTAAHTVRKKGVITVTAHDGKSHEAKVLKVDKINDIALLKIEAATIPLTPRMRVRMGERVSTIGFPNAQMQGTAPKITEGIISSLSGPQDDSRMLQISVPIQPGNSGGPLLDEGGAVVGVVLARLSDQAAFAQSGTIPQVVNYAQKISITLLLADEIETPDPVTKAKPVALPDMAEKAKSSIYKLTIR